MANKVLTRSLTFSPPTTPRHAAAIYSRNPSLLFHGPLDLLSLPKQPKLVSANFESVRNTTVVQCNPNTIGPPPWLIFLTRQYCMPPDAFERCLRTWTRSQHQVVVHRGELHGVICAYCASSLDPSCLLNRYVSSSWFSSMSRKTIHGLATILTAVTAV